MNAIHVPPTHHEIPVMTSCPLQHPENGDEEAVVFCAKHCRFHLVGVQPEEGDFWAREDRVVVLEENIREYLDGLWDAEFALEAAEVETLLSELGLWREGEPVGLLDVGAGPGLMVDFWENYLGPAVGVEPSPTARERAIGMVTVDVEAAYHLLMSRLEPQDPWCLRFAFVLEHLVDPEGFVRDLLRTFPIQPFVIQILVPHDFSWLQQEIRHVLGTKAWWVVRRHLHYFDYSGTLYLRAALHLGEAPGTWRLAGTWPTEVALLMGARYDQDEEDGKGVHRGRLELLRILLHHLDKPRFQQFAHLLGRFGFCRAFILTGTTDRVRDILLGKEVFDVNRRIVRGIRFAPRAGASSPDDDPLS